MQFTSTVRRSSMIQITFFGSFRGSSAKTANATGPVALLSIPADKEENGFAFFPAAILIMIDTKLFI